MQAVGHRIAELREATGRTQEQLAESLELSPRYIQMIEAGRANVALRTLIAIATALGVDPLALFEDPKKRVVRTGRPRKSRTEE